MRQILSAISMTTYVLAGLYGEIMAIRLFFTAAICRGVGNCQPIIRGMNPLVVIVLFLVYLGISPLVTILYAWPGYLLAALLSWLAEGSFRPPWQRSSSRDREQP